MLREEGGGWISTRGDGRNSPDQIVVESWLLEQLEVASHPMPYDIDDINDRSPDPGEAYVVSVVLVVAPCVDPGRTENPLSAERPPVFSSRIVASPCSA